MEIDKKEHVVRVLTLSDDLHTLHVLSRAGEQLRITGTAPFDAKPGDLLYVWDDYEPPDLRPTLDLHST